jgi:hypothetical protein
LGSKKGGERRMSSSKILDEINSYRSIINKSLIYDEQIDCWNDYQSEILDHIINLDDR